MQHATRNTQHTTGLINFLKFWIPSELNGKVNLILIMLFSTLLFINFSACKQELESPLVQIKSNPDDFDWASGIIGCTSTNCTQVSCFCYQANCCDRQDLDPCDFTDMGDYAIAVARELCKATNSNCLQKSFPIGCVQQPSVCYDFSYLQSGLFSEDPDGNPFHFCSNAECGNYYCEDLGPTFYLHRPLTIALQDEIASLLFTLDSLFRPVCDSTLYGPNCKARFGNIYFSVCTDPNKSDCENLGDPCWDTKIIVRFEYYCCPCTLPG